MLKCPRRLWGSWLSPGNQNYERVLFHCSPVYLGSFWVKITEIYSFKKTCLLGRKVKSKLHQLPHPDILLASLSTEAPVNVIYI